MTHPKFVEGEMRVIGRRWSPRAHAIKQFLARSRVPYRWLDVEGDAEARAVATAALPGVDRFPVVLFPDGSAVADPDVRAVAQKLGLPTDPEARLYDLIVVGGGPAGLTASINAASEPGHQEHEDRRHGAGRRRRAVRVHRGDASHRVARGR